MKEEITLKRWVLILLISIMIPLMGFTLNSVIMLANTQNNVQHNHSKIEVNSQDIKELERDKADKDQLDKCYDLLIIINNKMDNYILSHE